MTLEEQVIEDAMAYMARTGENIYVSYSRDFHERVEEECLNLKMQEDVPKDYIPCGIRYVVDGRQRADYLFYEEKLDRWK